MTKWSLKGIPKETFGAIPVRIISRTPEEEFRENLEGNILGILKDIFYSFLEIF